jgi:hypothetical protein
MEEGWETDPSTVDRIGTAITANLTEYKLLENMEPLSNEAPRRGWLIAFVGRVPPLGRH